MLNKIIMLILSFLLIFNNSCGNSNSVEKGKRYFKAADFEKACEIFEKNIKKTEIENEEIYFYLAVCYQKLGKMEKSLELFEKILSDDFESEMKKNEEFVLKLEKERDDILLELAYHHGIKGDFDKSSDYLNRVIKDYSYFQYHLGKIALNRKEYRKASGLFDTALNSRGKKSEELDTLFTIEVCFEKTVLFKELYSVTRDPEDFLKAYKNIRLVSNLMLFSHIPEKFVIRVNKLKRELSQFPIYGEKYEKMEKAFDELKIYERGNEHENIVKVSKEIIANSPVDDDKVYAGIKLGDALLELGKKDEAITAYKKALDIAENIRSLSNTDIEDRILAKFKKLGIEIDKK
ncbi:MAG: tetratricopeptide repeat protein [Candidatus Muirbacterium halophilum]|nr:tetratricopeptide repeat protein [Candidatus Muirbacterium halophilum]